VVALRAALSLTGTILNNGDRMKTKRARTNDPRPARTQTALLAAAQRLLQDQPLEALTIDEIVNAAQVGRGSFYNHFADKEILGKAIAARIRAHMTEEIDRANSGCSDPVERLMRALFASIRYAVTYNENARVIVNMALNTTDPGSPMNARLVSDLELGIRSGAFNFRKIDVGVAIVVGIFTAAIRHVLDVQVESAGYWSELAARMAMALGVAPEVAESLATRIVLEYPLTVRPAIAPDRSAPTGDEPVTHPKTNRHAP
jgi:AcrR family transcriptional regulator